MTWNNLILSPSTKVEMQRVVKQAPDKEFIGLSSGADPLTGIVVEVVEDALERKERAWFLSMMTGKEVAYEGDEGQLLIVSMPECERDFFSWKPGVLDNERNED